MDNVQRFETIDPVPVMVCAAATVVVLLAIILRQKRRPRAVITSLYIYPVKGCRGVRVTSAEFDSDGFKHDRRYMVVRPGENGSPDVFMHQRVLPRMVLVAAELAKLPSGGDALRITAGGDSLLVPQLAEGEGVSRTVRVWDDVCKGAIDQGDEAAELLSSFLQTPVRLVYKPASCVRPVHHKFRTRGTTNTTSFADGFPFLIASEESLADVDRRTETPLDMRRFRPNIVVRGQPAFSEDRWTRLQLNGMTFYGVKKCTRCRVTTVNPDDGTGNDPELDALKTLRTFRLEKDNETVCFGLNVMPKWNRRIARSNPSLHVGAEVIVDDTDFVRYSKTA